MAGRRVGRALLGSGLLVVTALGGAGGYGLGLLTTDQPASAGTSAAPLAGVDSSTSPTPTVPPKTIIPDDSEPLRASDIRYKTRVFTARGTVESHVSVKAPSTWDMTQPDPPKEGRFNEPARKRWIRVEAGFTIQRAPEVSMDLRIAQLRDSVPASQMVTIKSHKVDLDTKNATLAYTYVPENGVRYVVIRWVANRNGLCIFEIAATGLPQDKPALEAILDHASESATRSDSRLS